MTSDRDQLDHKLRELRDSMRRHMVKPMRAWSTGEVIAVSTVELWEEDLTVALAMLSQLAAQPTPEVKK